jgi:ATP-dependent helicase HepA
MPEFIPGQRWISDTELQMGLGVVTEAGHRTVTLLFPATGEQRTYASESAPLTRVRVADGDAIQNLAGKTLTVVSHKEAGGLITYTVIDNNKQTSELDEGELNHQMQLSRPTDRLFSGQIDSDKSFQLRYLSRVHANRVIHSEVHGLTGGRTSLLPHQLYIAHEVARRYAPRVLLADEVGLGKTIEAGLIIHQQLLTERAHRILIVVPESLVHQWLVEMLRRFNLHFSIFNQSRFESLQIEESGNPFLSEQLVLCSLGFLLDPEILHMAVDAGWDMLVVDEAHHLQWSEEEASPEYKLVEALAETSKGVLLLTATPEQLGKASHFARLRLLDPDRFSSLEHFLKEEQEYEPIARTVDELLNDQPLDDTARNLLATTLIEGDNAELLDKLQSNDDSIRKPAEQELVNHLLDRHGTGRVLFRNTRATVKGFPQRNLVSNPLPLPADYKRALDLLSSNPEIDPELMLYPELVYEASKSDSSPDWFDIDPRVDWLQQLMKSLKPEKILVIAASADTVLDLAIKLKDSFGIHAAVFHEGMSIVERDRAAAYFADTVSGSQVLICSEIGSEGRNFQFAHHLVLFDLPLNPDLLEQRIGRLDRIGQTDTILIHVPYFEHSAQDVMQRWYHQGLNAFEQTCPAGHSVFVAVTEELVAALRSAGNESRQLEKLIQDTSTRYQKMIQALHNGRDRLLEINSCRPEIANALQATGLKADNDPALVAYLELVFDQYGVDSDYHSQDCLVLHPSEHVQANFPGLTEDGMTVTFNRDIALTNEDMAFLTWEHPLVTWAMDLVMTSELGNSGFTVIKDERFKPGTLILECLYILESASTDQLQSLRYLPPTLMRVVTDTQGRDLAEALPHDKINAELGAVDAETASQIVRGQSDVIKQILQQANQFADTNAKQEIETAHRHTRQALSSEINRLKALKQVNPNVRDEEITWFENQWQLLNDAIGSARPRLDAVRVVVAT